MCAFWFVLEMLSALKRLTSKNDTTVSTGPPGHHAMSQNLQRKFAKGVQYNSKYKFYFFKIILLKMNNFDTFSYIY